MIRWTRPRAVPVPRYTYIEGEHRNTAFRGTFPEQRNIGIASSCAVPQKCSRNVPEKRTPGTPKKTPNTPSIEALRYPRFVRPNVVRARPSVPRTVVMATLRQGLSWHCRTRCHFGAIGYQFLRPGGRACRRNGPSAILRPCWRARKTHHRHFSSYTGGAMNEQAQVLHTSPAHSEAQAASYRAPACASVGA